jgi:hypothetical protein
MTETEESSRRHALEYIWKALKVNEVTRPDLVASIVSRAVPVTWIFLLDAYAYVLLKAGHVTFSKALLAECINEDPYFSSPYLHLAEWCIADVLRTQNELRVSEGNASAYQTRKDAIRRTVERSQRVGRLCLRIALALEEKRESLTKRRGEQLLRDYSVLLSEAI